MSIRMFAICAAILVGVPVRPSIGDEGKDYPGLGRIEGYKISRYEDRRFDRHNFPLSDRQMPIEGHVISIRYVVDGSGPTASPIEIIRSYKTVLDALNGESLQYKEDQNSCDGCIVDRFTRNSQNIFVQIDVGAAGQFYDLAIVEERPFRPMIQQSGPTTKP
jgi:hypothetical protein